jgi:hypothetical protein
MAFRILSALLVALALMAAPVLMGGAAMAQAPAAEAGHAGHCGGEAPADEKKAPVHLGCAGSCAAMPAFEPVVVEHEETPKAAIGASALTALIGIAPERETPPPRCAPEKRV